MPARDPLSRHTALRYLQPLREGGSLPAVVDTDGGAFVAKFRGAGQGAKALVAELVVGRIASAIGLPVPELALIELPEAFGQGEPDPEIQDVLRASRGLNVGLRYLDGAFNFAPSAAGELVSPELASRVVWLDAYLTNPDRTHRNPNLLVWRRTPWLIDHGAALYAHHDWSTVDSARTRAAFTLIEHHVLLELASDLRQADDALAPMLDEPVIADVLESVPDDFLLDSVRGPEFTSAAAARERYRSYLTERLRHRRGFVEEAIAARERLLASPPIRLAARR